MDYQSKVRSCTEQDIPVHYNVVSPLVQNTNPEKYKARMMEAVKANTAFTLLDGSCFLYYTCKTKYDVYGVCAYGTGNSIGFFILCYAIFYDSPINILRFHPHNREQLKGFKSLLSVSSIKNWYRHGTPVVVRIDKLRERVKNMLNKKFTDE